MCHLEKERGFHNPAEIQRTELNGLEDVLINMLKICDRESEFIKGSKPYNKVNNIQCFRKNLFHFE